jgi:hypothetical protein
MKERESISQRIVQEKHKIIRKENKYVMKKEKDIRLWSGVLAIVIFSLATVMLIAQPQAYAVTCPTSSTADYDSDGYTDTQECAGITLLDNSLVALNPNLKDIFIILVPANPSSFPANPLGYISASTADGGLAITTHTLSSAQAGANREITATQKAVRIGESLDTSTPNVLGLANYTNPNGSAIATIFTECIKNFVNSVYASAGATVPAGLIDAYTRHTIAHETGHMLSLTTTYNDRFGGYHYKTGTNVIMDQSVYYTNKSGVVNFYIGTKYAATDQSGFKLK